MTKKLLGAISLRSSRPNPSPSSAHRSVAPTPIWRVSRAATESSAISKTSVFEGRIVTVNPKYSEVMGFPCYPDIASIPEPVDCVVSAVPNRHVPDLLESAANAGVRAAVVFAAGFGEIGGEGKTRQARLEAFPKNAAFSSAGRTVTAC